MRFNELTHMMQKPEPKPDTYEAGMALNQLLKIGTHAIKIHNMIDDDAEMEAWVAKKIDLASNYVKSVHGYTAGQKAGTYNDDGMTEDAGSLTDQQKKGLDMVQAKYGNNVGGNGDSLPQGYMKARLATGVSTDGVDDSELEAALKKYGYDSMYDAEQADDNFYEKIYNKEHLPITVAMVDALAKVMGTDFDNDAKLSDAYDYLYNRDESVSEDAGEGHMSKSQLYQTAKMAIELLDMIKKGDDLEGWVQTKLNLAADYLQAVYHYEDYQKLNPYREELDSGLRQRHAGIIQKHLDEILERKCRAEDVDTKPGMMRILAKRVNEVEKEIAKEQRKNTDEAHGGQHTSSGRSMTKGEMNKREKIVKGMKKNKAGFKKRYGKDAEAVMYATATKNAMKDDEQMQEGIKDWAKNLAMAGVIVAGLAGVGSIQDAIDRSVPAVAAIEKALEMAQDQGNDELAKMIEKDLSAVKIRLSSGKDLSFVKGMQDKYSKFIQTEGLAYESQLALALNQRLK